ncbi:MAG: hypothetical protein ACTSO9_10855, partial [Candidatus Helarchaeota archaeon]
EKEITSAEATIKSSMSEIAELKKELKISDFKKAEKTKKIKEDEKLVNELKSKIKNNSKYISKLPGNTKSKINKFKGKLKEFYKLTTGFLKIVDTKIDINRLLKLSEDHFNYVKTINSEIPLHEFIKNSKIELKIKRNNKEFKITNFNQYVIFYLESILYYILEAIEEEIILKNKRVLAETALSHARAILKYAKLAKISETEYFVDLEKFCESEFCSILAHKEFKEFNLTKATSYFLGIKKRLKSITTLDKRFKTVISEKMKIAEAWACDAYNLIYLFNSYKNWQQVAESENSQIREIAQITKDKVEDFVTSQFGFPEEEKINKIIKEIKWPSSSSPDLLDKIKPIC